MQDEVKVTPDRQFWGLVDTRGEDECWQWKGGLMPAKPKAISGYGYYYIGRKRVPAHRYSYILANGAIASDMVVDHLCRNPCCVNPAHLEAVSNVENVMRGMSPAARNARKTHCTYGHFLADDNVYLHRGKRYCRKCKRERQERAQTQPDFKKRRAQKAAAYRARLKEAAATLGERP